MARLYKGYDLRGEYGEVAVKLLPPGASERHRGGFERERQALERLRHPNIVELLHGGVDPSDQPYLVFPWLGARLQDEMLARGPMAWDDWWKAFGAPVLAALEAAHTRDIHHRDLKPANVMLDPTGRPKVIDFGISKIVGLLAPEATVDGASAPFTPRELVADSPGMTRDTHAWAALTVFAVSGVDPYPPEPDDPWEMLERARHAATPRLPAPVRSIVDRCLSSDPSIRPLNALVLASELGVTLEKVRRSARQDADQGMPAVPVIIGEGIRTDLETALDLYPADLAEFIEQELQGDVYVVDTGHKERLRIIGATLSLTVTPHPGGHALVVGSAAELSATVLDRDRAQGWPCTLRLRVGAPRDRDQGVEAVRELLQRAGEARLAAIATGGTGRARPFEVWRGLLALLRAWESGLEDPVPYSSVGVHRGRLRVELARADSSLTVGEIRVVPTDSGHDFAAVVTSVGRYTADLEPVGDTTRGPASRGTLRRDRRWAQMAIDRQFKAVDAVEYGRAVRADLADLLVDPARVRPPVPAGECEFRQPLDEAKQAAVRAAVGSPDLLLVQGPPGTGKTTFITELVLQELDRDPGCRILLASQSHAPLDHALAGIDAQREHVEAVRLAREDDDRVASSSHAMLLDRRVEQWRTRAVRSGERWLTRWAKAAGIDAGAVEAAARLQVLAGDLRQLERLDQRRREVDEDLARLRADHAGAAQGSTVAQKLREGTEELDDVRLERATCADEIKEHIARLADLGQLKRRTRPGHLVADDLERQADDLLPDDQRAAEACRRLLALLSDWQARFGAGPAFRAAALARAQVVAATCVGLAGQRGADQVEFDLVIVDEASKATAPELLIPLSRARRIVLVGDDRQLPPYVEEGALDDSQLAERGLTGEEVRQPLFAALAQQLPADNRVQLSHQHRMHPAIGRLISACFYENTLTSQDRPALQWLGIVAPRPVMWLTTAGYRGRRDRSDGPSFRNDLEVQAIATLLNTINGLAAAAGTRTSIAVLTGYAAQRDALERRLARSTPTWRALTGVECQTVDAFQGRQAPIVIYSLTRSNGRGQVGFLRERPRLNVALSRAQDALFIVGDHAFARQAKSAPSLRRVLEHVEEYVDDCCLLEARVS